MGIGAPGEDETHEITVELEGEISKEAFEEYVRQLRECLAKLAKITDAGKGGKYIKVRQIRAKLVRRPPKP